MIKNIYPKSPIQRLRREDLTEEDLRRRIDTETVATVVGMSRNFVVRAADYASGSRPRTLSLEQVLGLLDLDGYQETFVPRSLVPRYLLATSMSEPAANAVSPIELPSDPLAPMLVTGHAGELIKGLPSQSVQCAVTSSPYWGMRIYDQPRFVRWADDDHCPYGFEQTPEGFIRHTVELLYLLKRALTANGSVWWNLMDTYNTRTPIRGSSVDKLKAMQGDPDHALGWTEHEACRHSAGHMYLDDAELAMIPARVAERASRIGYRVKSYITWNKNSTPEPVKSRATRQAEVILHLSAGTTPYFNRPGWQKMQRRLGGWHETFESSEKLTDVWYLPTSSGTNGHGAEFPLSLPGRCIELTSKPGDLVLDPFVGSGTTALAAMELGRRCIGFDISQNYIERAQKRVKELSASLRSENPLLVVAPQRTAAGRRSGRQRSNGSKPSGDALPLETKATRRR